jgi:hypothetical protein
LLDGVTVSVAAGALGHPAGAVEHGAGAANFDVHGGPRLVSSDTGV